MLSVRFSPFQVIIDKENLPEEVDHIILGSGPGALICASLLSRCGHSCLVLEPGDSLGNLLFKRKDVKFEVG